MNEHNNAPLCECGCPARGHYFGTHRTVCQCIKCPDCKRFTPTATDAREDADKPKHEHKECVLFGCECKHFWQSPAKPADPSLAQEAEFDGLQDVADKWIHRARHECEYDLERQQLSQDIAAFVADFTARKVRDERIKIAEELNEYIRNYWNEAWDQRLSFDQIQEAVDAFKDALEGKL